MKNNTVIAFIDDSKYSDIVCQYAAWLASKNKSKIKLYHIIEKKNEEQKKDLSGAINLGARTSLLENLSESGASASRTRHSEGWAILEKAHKTLKSIGTFVVEPRLRTGDVADALSRKEEAADVVLIGKRGEVKQDSQSRLGLNFERIVRASKKPIFVANRNFRQIKNILVGFDGSPATRRIIDFISGYEFLSRGYKCVCFTDKFPVIGLDHNFKKKGLFWSNSTNFDEMITLIDSVKMINPHDWEKNYKDYSKKILPYDKENKFKKSVIYNFLK